MVRVCEEKMFKCPGEEVREVGNMGLRRGRGRSK